MYLKSLIIVNGVTGAIIRDIQFKLGLNLIIDETVSLNGKETGNNVGKTTVLKLIDFCLGADPKGIYTDSEHRRNEYKLVKSFLVNEKVMVRLTLKDDLDIPDSREFVIERNFLSRSNKIQRINGREKSNDGFDEALTSMLFDGHYGKKPTFRQIISHNIRYKDVAINNTLKNLDVFTRDDEYETLYLFLLGCNFTQGDAKQELRSQIDTEEKFKRRLEEEQTSSAYKTALALLETEIEELEHKKDSLNLNPEFEADLDRLNLIKFEINTIASEISRLEMRKRLIQEAQQNTQSGIAKIDVRSLKQVYEQTTALISNLHRTFEEMLQFHNKMIESKVQFIAQDLPKIDADLNDKKQNLAALLRQESELSVAITRCDSFEDLEQLIADLNAKYQKKGEFESTLRQINAVDEKLSQLNDKLTQIDGELFSDEFAYRIQEQINKFNRFFSGVSHELYGEKYALKFEPKIKKGRRLYEFSAFNLNFSSGKKQGEISCFDIAYTLFADDENIPCMHFLLNDKKELMHDNQLTRIARLADAKGIQFVTSILKDKLPKDLMFEENAVVKLSQQNKLFRIEASANHDQ
jgi:uncharacterized protein YydD (DUF2326 family)